MLRLLGKIRLFPVPGPRPCRRRIKLNISRLAVPDIYVAARRAGLCEVRMHTDPLLQLFLLLRSVV